LKAIPNEDQMFFHLELLMEFQIVYIHKYKLGKEKPLEAFPRIRESHHFLKRNLTTGIPPGLRSNLADITVSSTNIRNSDLILGSQKSISQLSESKLGFDTAMRGYKKNHGPAKFGK